MPFAENLKKEVRRRAIHFCCVCKTPGSLEVHHIIPQSEGGPDTFENAIPICPWCHETYGGNPTKRGLLREMRDVWYEVCQNRYSLDRGVNLATVADLISKLPTKSDLEQLRAELRASAPAPSGSRVLTVEELTAHLLTKGYRLSEDFTQVFFAPALWEGEMAKYRRRFLKTFGTSVARCVCLDCIDEVGLDEDGKLTEAQAETVMQRIHMTASIMVLCDDGFLEATLSTEEGLRFKLNDVFQDGE
jgi:hypothetical protein